MRFDVKQLKKILPVINGIIFIIVFLFLVLPEFQSFRGLQKTIKEQQKAIINKQEVLGLIASLDRSKISRLEYLMPDKAQEPELLAQAEQLAAQSNLALSSVNFKVNQAAGEVVISEELSGAYGYFKDFLDNLEKNLRLMDILSINISQIDKSNALKFNLEIKTYFSPPQLDEQER